MKQLLSYTDIPDLGALAREALTIKAQPFAHKDLGTHKTVGLIFFNPSLRTRLSTQLAAANLGMTVLNIDFGKESWRLETQDGVVMDGDTTEHIEEAAGVIGEYCDVIGIRLFASLNDRERDYQEEIFHKFRRFSGKPVVNLESAREHPLQALADLMTIEEHRPAKRPKVVLTWAPHCKALPQAVANSFSSWMARADVDFCIAHPKGYELASDYVQGVHVTHDQREALDGADFVYAKNWSSYQDYGKILTQDRSWTVDADKMQLTNEAFFMHCLPVRRNLVVTEDVLTGPRSLVLQQAKNRVFAAQAVLARILAEQETWKH